MAEYRYLADSFWRNEEAGEKRVNFFITLVTAVLAALVALTTRQGALTEGQTSGVAFMACVALLAVGVLTFRRLIHRNLVTDRYKASLDHIRDRFKGWDPSGLAGYDPFPTGGGGARSFGRGGLTDLVAAVNSVIAAAGLAALVALSGSIVAAAGAAAIGFVLALGAHAAYLEYRYHGTWLHPLWMRVVRMSGPREVESTLVVVSEAPGDVLQIVEGLSAIAGHVVGPARSERIRDRYFDTRNRELGKHCIALRLRELNGRTLVTLKGSSVAGRSGGEDRFELEDEWSEKAWRDVRAELGRREVVLSPRATGALEPYETLAAAGLGVVQDREADRRVRDILPRDGSQRRVAELALDRVTYHFSGHDARHHEVEVEAKARGGEEAVAAVTTALVESYWPSLRPWPHGKLPTGEAVQRLLGEGEASNLLDRDGLLKTRAYDKIAEVLARASEPGHNRPDAGGSARAES